jgi:hypothetical protein
MATGVATISTPDKAQFHGDGGGFHGGGFHGGVWGWPGWAVAVGGAQGRLGRRDPGWAIAAAIVPVGVAIASQPAYGGGPGFWVRRRRTATIWAGGW